MAVDATGTPTTLGIPKFDVANDAPSGLGFNAAMDSIDTLLRQTVMSSNIAGIAIGSVPVWNGSTWVKPTGTPDGTKFLRDDGTWASVPAPVAATYGTALPGSPADGAMHVLVDSTTAPTYQWTLRYNASNSTSYKWEFVGGTPQYNQSVSGGAIASGAYAAPGTAVPVTPARPGVYVCRYTCTVDWATANSNGERFYASFNGAGQTASDGTASFTFQQPSLDGGGFSLAQERVLTLTTASGLQMLFKDWQNTGFTISMQHLSITPVSVS